MPAVGGRESGDRGASCLVEQGRGLRRVVRRGAFHRAFRDGCGCGEGRELGDQAVQDLGGLGGPGPAGGAWSGEQRLLVAGGVGQGPSGAPSGRSDSR
jgi:hypothetical protein